jgi:predicted pyridoxine 5'-phosphate oxidase superfamily flavin-nucleotide-binding protein
MAKSFGSIAFTPVVQALQEKYGSRTQYARMEASAVEPMQLGPEERDFIGDMDHFYLATVSETGWPYVQHRGGSKGFLKVLDGKTLAFGDLRGNKQYISAGNLAANDRVALIMVDYVAQARLKILGRSEILEGDAARDSIERVRDPNEKVPIERVFLIHVEAFDWNCPQHITPRYTAEQVHEAIQPLEDEIQELRTELAKLKGAQ